MKFFVSIAFVLIGSIALADVSYVCNSEVKTDDNIHLNFSINAPHTVGYARAKISGEQVVSGPLTCTEKSGALLNCFIVLSGKKSDLSIQGQYSKGEKLSLTESTRKYNCTPKTGIPAYAGDAGALKKCVGVFSDDGNVTYKEDCLSPSKTLVKKGAYQTGIQGPVDTPEKAMELYNKTKNQATTIEREKSSK